MLLPESLARAVSGALLIAITHMIVITRRQQIPRLMSTKRTIEWFCISLSSKHAANNGNHHEDAVRICVLWQRGCRAPLGLSTHQKVTT